MDELNRLTCRHTSLRIEQKAVVYWQVEQHGNGKLRAYNRDIDYVDGTDKIVCNVCGLKIDEIMHGWEVDYQ